MFCQVFIISQIELELSARKIILTNLSLIKLLLVQVNLSFVFRTYKEDLGDWQYPPSYLCVQYWLCSCVFVIIYLLYTCKHVTKFTHTQDAMEIFVVPIMIGDCMKSLKLCLGSSFALAVSVPYVTVCCYWCSVCDSQRAGC